MYTAPLTAPVPRLPYGSVTRPVEVLPALSVVVDPAVRVVPVEAAGAPPGDARPGISTTTSDRPTAPVNAQPDRPTPTSDRPATSANHPAAIPIHVRVTANTAPLPTTTRLEVPAGWAAAPTTVAHDFTRAGEIAEVAFAVTPPDGWEGRRHH